MTLPDELRVLLADLVDPEPCGFDHHGYCQEHGWLERAGEVYGEGREGRDCPHGRAQRLLSLET